MLQRIDSTLTANVPERRASSGLGRLSNAGLLGAAALVALILLVAAAYYLYTSTERENRRAELISDALWVEQTLRFALASDRGELDRIASDIRRGLPRSAIADQLEQFHRLHPEVARVTYSGFDDGTVLSAPTLDPRDKGVIAGLPVVVAAIKLGEDQFGAAYADPGGEWRFDLALPADSTGGQAILLASFSIGELLNAHIPWWVARKNHVAVRDASGALVGAKSSVEAGLSQESHTIPFDPPGHGLVIVTTRYATPARWLSYALPATIAVLAGLVGASIVLMQRNVRRRQRAEERWRTENAFRRSMEDALTIGMRARDREGRIIYANQAFCDMVGWSREELIGRAPPMPYWDSETIEQTRNLHDSILAGQGPHEGFEIRFRRSSGEPLDALVYEAALYDASGAHVGWMASILDVTERKRIGELTKMQAEELARTARLVSMGEMASTLAHEINQPLTAISTYAAGLADQMTSGQSDPERTAAVLTKVSEQARRAGAIVRHLREFTRRAQPKLETLDMHRIARRVAGFVDADLARAGVVLNVEEAPDACLVTGDPVLLEQVILNLVRNAAEAMSGCPKKRRRIDISIAERGGSVTVRVRDHGPGLAPGMAGKLFTPFVSTKADGMGMGLNICRSIVELHGGRIWQEPAEPGCIFAVSIPAAQP